MGLDILENRKIFCYYQDSIPRPSRSGNSCYTDHATPPPKFYPRKDHECPALATLHHAKKPCIHCTGGWVGPWASMDQCGKSTNHTVIEAPENTAQSNALYLQHEGIWWEKWSSSTVTSTLNGHQWLPSCSGWLNPGKESRYPLNKSLGGPECWSEHFGEQKTLLSQPGF